MTGDGEMPAFEGTIYTGPESRMVRERILRRFTSWLDGALAAEDPPAGVAAEILAEVETGRAEGSPGDFSDFYSMWSAITALTQEVRLQGRAFKQLHDSLARVSDLRPAIDATLGRHEEALAEVRRVAGQSQSVRGEWERAIQRDAGRQAQKEILEALLDMRDRLNRGLDSARAARKKSAELPDPNWLQRLRGPDKRGENAEEAAAALEKGYILSLQRLDDLADRLDARQIDCLGSFFDPRSMCAVDLEENSEEPDGTVLEVYRNGYEWQGEVFRLAQVKVARGPELGTAAAETAAGNEANSNDEGDF